MTPQPIADPDFIPAQAAPPPAPSGGADPDFTPAQTAPAAASASPIRNALGHVEDAISAPIIGPVTGVIKGAANSVAGVMELANKYSPQIGAHPEATHAALDTAANFIRQHAQAHGPFEKGGEIAESVAELMTPEALAEAGKIPDLMSFGEHLSEAAKNAKILESHPVIARLVKTAIDAGKSAVKSGAEMGAQGFVKSGGDPEAAEDAALVGGATGGVLGAGGSALGQAAEALRPTSESLEGVTMPVAASQRPGASLVTKLASEPQEIPAMEAARQAAAPQIIRNGARRALSGVLDDVNSIRGEMQGPPEGGGGPAAGKYKFTIAPHGQPVETTDPNIVQKLLNEAKDFKSSDNYGELGPRQKARVDSTVDDLTNQLDQYHTELATRPHFVPIDKQAALASADDYGTAGEIAQNSIDDVYQRMRGAANEQLDKKWLKQLSPADFNTLMEQNTANFSPEERQMATDTYRKGVALKDFHDAIQKGFNVSPGYAAATANVGGARTFTGSNRIANSIDDVISKHGDDLRSMIGNEGIRSVQRMNQLMKDPETKPGLEKVLRATASVMRRGHGGISGFLGSAAAPFLGIDHLTGAAGGIATGYAVKKIVNKMATDPAIADRIAYAVKNGVSSSIAGPLIALMITNSDKQQQETPAK